MSSVSGDGPTFDLGQVQRLVRIGQWTHTYRAARDAAELRFDRVDIRECVLGLGPDDFVQEPGGRDLVPFLDGDSQMMLTECPVCAGEVKRIVAPREIPVGRDRVTVPLEYQVCQRCGEEFVDPDTFASAQREAAAAVRDKKDLLSPEDILRIRVEAGLTQAQLEARLELGPKTIGRWERGTVCPSRAASKLLRLYAEYPELFVDRERTVVTARLEPLVSRPEAPEPRVFLRGWTVTVQAQGHGAVPGPNEAQDYAA